MNNLDQELRAIHELLHGRLFTHQEVAKRARWTTQELEGVLKQDEHLFYKELKTLIATQKQELLKELIDCGEIHHSVYDYRMEELC